MSKINVDTLDKQSGSTVTVGGPGTNVILGTTGQTVTLGCGATQTGFGRTGTVNWQTGSIKTGTFTAVNGEGYFVNTSGGVSTANLPAGSGGAIVSFSDYTRTFATNNLTIAANGSEKIGGVAETVTLDVNGQALTLVYVDATEGWINVQNAEDTETGVAAAFVTATGGTITTVCTNFKVHTFTGSGTFAVSCAGNPKGSNTVSYTVVGGGAGGGGDGGGGGGASGFREGKATYDSYTASPLAAATGLPVSAISYPVVVGAGGAPSSTQSPQPWICSSHQDGNDSSFSTITSTKGGGASRGAANAGGSGGGGGRSSPNAGGAGNTPPVSPPQGNLGGDGSPSGGSGGGGGAGAAGTTAPASTSGAPGGNGATTSITNSPVTYGGGGGGGATPGPGTKGIGGTGGGGNGAGCASVFATSGVANTGGGGGGGSGSLAPNHGGAGGSGIVVIRYKFQ